jgi:hypothetical protein
MQTAKSGIIIGALFLCAGIALLQFNPEITSAETKVQYKKDECVKCHAARVKDIAEAGMKRRSVPCIGCHIGHPPEVKKPIAQCSKCHLRERKAHYGIPGCLNCHTNPHTPLKVTVKNPKACLDCHGLQAKQLFDSMSRHSLLDCTFCHDVHRKVPQCTQCHKPHLGNAQVNCRYCHKAHTPKYVAYAPDAPSKDCGTCHKKASMLMSASTTKHKLLACANCHQEKHHMVPTCQNCHGSPHPAGIKKKFPMCDSCHNGAHNLNNWIAPAVNGPQG